jgi:hypothetical protein
MRSFAHASGLRVVVVGTVAGVLLALASCGMSGNGGQAPSSGPATTNAPSTAPSTAPSSSGSGGGGGWG